MNTQHKPYEYAVVLQTMNGPVELQTIAMDDKQAREMVTEFFAGEIISVIRGDSAYA